MVIDAANSSSNDKENQKDICRVIYPSGQCTLELKTNQQIKQHFEQYGNYDANCGRITLSEVINITRINALNKPVKSSFREPIRQALNHMALKAEEKYKKGFTGIIRRIISLVFNLFVTKSVGLFAMPGTHVELLVVQNKNKSTLPFFIGDNAKFARLIADRL